MISLKYFCISIKDFIFIDVDQPAHMLIEQFRFASPFSFVWIPAGK